MISEIETEPDEGCDWGKAGQIALAIAGGFAVIGYFAGKKRRISTTPVGPSIQVQETTDTEAGMPFPPCSAKEREKVREIFKTVAEGQVAWWKIWSATVDGKPNLSCHKVWGRLMRLGEEIDGIHPFAFLSAPSKDHVRAIFNGDSSFKRGKVLGGIKKGMEREEAARNLYRYIPNFAAQMGKNPGPIRPLIQAHDWTGLVNYLFDTNAPREG